MNRIARVVCIYSMFCSPTVFASDGVVEINHACASGPGCFSGDSAGYPVVIDGTAGRSYQLTSDLIVPDVGTHGLKVDASGISIDLKGFEIIRAGCVGSTTNCTPPEGLGSGILVASASTIGVSVKNGSITGMNFDGATMLGTQGHVEGLRVRWNGRAGIFASRSSLITGNSAFQNGNWGIAAVLHSYVSENTTFGNTGPGIEIDGKSKARNNVSGENGSVDICGGGICTEKKRYFRSNNEVDGSEASDACPEGFHFASIYELMNNATLAYDSMLGQGGISEFAPKPEEIGWIDDSTATCLAWTSNDPLDAGGHARLGEASNLSNPTINNSPWILFFQTCDVDLPVWCVED